MSSSTRASHAKQWSTKKQTATRGAATPEGLLADELADDIIDVPELTVSRYYSINKLMAALTKTAR